MRVLLDCRGEGVARDEPGHTGNVPGPFIPQMAIQTFLPVELCSKSRGLARSEMDTNLCPMELLF